LINANQNTQHSWTYFSNKNSIANVVTLIQNKCQVTPRLNLTNTVSHPKDRIE